MATDPAVGANAPLPQQAWDDGNIVSLADVAASAVGPFLHPADPRLRLR